MRTAELALKRLIVAGTQDPNWSVQLDPVDRPDFRAASRSTSRRPSGNALSQRTDLEIAKKSMQANDVTLRYPRATSCSRRPTCRSTYGSAGWADRSSTVNRTRRSAARGQHDPGRYRRCVQLAVPQRLPAAGPAQVNFSYPLGDQLAGGLGGSRARCR